MKRRKALNAPSDVPLLGQEKIRELKFVFESDRRRKYKHLRRIYSATVMSVIAVVLALLLIGAKVDARLFSQDYFDSITELFLGRGFINPWGEDNSNPKDHVSGSATVTEDVQAGVTFPEGDIPNEDTVSPPLNLSQLYSFDYSKVPDGHTPIIPMDLSLYTNGDNYINNSTGYSPDIEALLNSKLQEPSIEYLANVSAPTVLIIHTHGTEAYSDDGAISYYDDGGEFARSHDTDKNVVAVGEVMSRILNENGIETLHCTVMHDSLQYKDSYVRAEETIRRYMEMYPSIKLVIDLHRDSIVKSSGEIVRPVTLVENEAAAQVMCVVGSDWAGGECPNWQSNLSLALKLRQKLNSEYTNICRPTDLRAQSFNQELSAYSLLLEIGSSGNSLEEAQLSAALVAQALCELISQL